jgi:hypothetical protein
MKNHDNEDDKSRTLGLGKSLNASSEGSNRGLLAGQFLGSGEWGPTYPHNTGSRG